MGDVSPKSHSQDQRNKQKKTSIEKRLSLQEKSGGWLQKNFAIEIGQILLILIRVIPQKTPQNRIMKEPIINNKG